MKISIPKPCHEDWSKMTTEEKGKFCQVCSKSVRDFSSLSDYEVINEISTDSNICGNFRTDQLDKNLYHSFINSLFTKFAVGFVLTSGGLISAQVQPKSNCDIQNNKPTIKRTIGKVAVAPSTKKDTIRTIGMIATKPTKNEQPLYILDGKVIFEKTMRSLDPKTIDKMKVLKGSAATALYGSEGKNGAIIITLKK